MHTVRDAASVFTYQDDLSLQQCSVASEGTLTAAKTIGLIEADDYGLY